MSMLSQEQIESMMRASRQAVAVNADVKPRSIHNYNFRSAGRLSNENARSLTAIHENFARNLASMLDAFLGTGIEVKLQTLDQHPVKEHINSIPPLTYIVPFAVSSISSAMILECDVDIVFPILDLLLGGTGASVAEPRELSEIEEEIMQDVTTLIARQAETAWHMPSMSVIPNRRIKSSMMHQYCPANERVTQVKFELEIAGTTGCLYLVFPISFLNALLKQIKEEQPNKKGGLRYFPTPSIRERILDCDFEVAAELTALKVAVRDLISLEPGSVLKLRAPVRTPYVDRGRPRNI